MPLKFVTSNRGQPMLCVEGFVCRKDRAYQDGKTTWRCSAKNCKARISTQDEEHSPPPEHTHAPDAVDIEVRSHLARLRESAVQNRGEQPSIAIASIVGSIESSAVMSKMPNVDLLRKKVVRARARASQPATRNPPSRAALWILDTYKVTERNEQFLLYDSGEGDVDRLVVFATQANVELMKEHDEWFVDGTFKVCPTIFYQLYTIHVKLADGKVVPTVYALLPSKTAATYQKLLNVIVDVLDGLHPQVVHVDFEMSMIKKLGRAFPAAGILGCNLHFCQSVWRHIQGIRVLRDLYVNDAEFGLNIRMFPALAFVPVNDVRRSFVALLEDDFVRENAQRLTEFINYFEATWIGRERNPPIMKVEWWNAHAATLEGMGQTNNAVEGWHCAFAMRLGSSHPTFDKFVQFLKKEQTSTEFLVHNSLAQGPGAPSKRIYRDCQRRLHELVSTYSSRGLLEFLKGVAHNLKF